VNRQDLQMFLISKREHLGFSQQDVVEKTGSIITRQYYGMIEKGERRPSVDVAKKIAEVLGIDWTLFFEQNSNLRLQKRIKIA